MTTYRVTSLGPAMSTHRVTARSPVLLGLDNLLLEMESHFAPKVQDGPVYHSWRPLPLHAFLPALECAWGHARERQPRRFLEVGAGIGTKLLLVRYIYREEVEVMGIERRPEYVEIACQRGVPVLTHAAEDYDHYADFEIVYCYRPAMESRAEAEIETRIFERMVPGAILILACGETVPAGWELLPEGSTNPWTQVWRKP